MSVLCRDVFQNGIFQSISHAVDVDSGLNQATPLTTELERNQDSLE